MEHGAWGMEKGVMNRELGGKNEGASGRMVEWENGRVGEWVNGRMGEWENGRVARGRI